VQNLLLLLIVSFVIGAWGCGVTAAQQPASMRVYVAGNAAKGGGGIVMSQLDMTTGQLSEPAVAAEFSSSFIAMHPSKRFLYAVAEKKDGSVRALSVDGSTGKLALLNEESSKGSGPCFLAIDPSGKNLLVANYSSGSAAVLPIDADGKLRPATAQVQHEGSGPDPKRQEGPHAHSINLDPTGRLALVADLGLDRIKIYRFDAVAGTLTPSDPAEVASPAGAGPRHLGFHPNGKFAYVSNEMASSVSAFAYDASSGRLTEIQTISTLPADYTSPNTTAQVAVHPSGKFVYVSNRGQNSIAMFKVDSETGKLTATGQEPTRGKTPRHFAIDPTGRWLLAANQDSGSVVVFTVDASNGALSATGSTIKAPMPMCVLFAP
jgi:6-phosphogluconolactonase